MGETKLPPFPETNEAPGCNTEGFDRKVHREMNSQKIDQSTTGCKTHLENFVKLVGARNLAPAILLFTVHEAFKLDDHTCIIYYIKCSRSGWAERTGLTKRQVKDAIIWLRAKDYIYTEQRRIGGKLVLHMHYKWPNVKAALVGVQSNG